MIGDARERSVDSAAASVDGTVDEATRVRCVLHCDLRYEIYELRQWEGMILIPIPQNPPVSLRRSALCGQISRSRLTRQSTPDLRSGQPRLPKSCYHDYPQGLRRESLLKPKSKSPFQPWQITTN